MRKLMVFLAVVTCFFVLAVGVQAYTITVTDPAGDQLGVSTFDSFFITYKVNDSTPPIITIGTNYPQAGLLVGAWQTLPADLLLDGSINGVGWDYAIPLVNHGGFLAGQVYSITSMSVSDDWEPAGGGYGYNHNVPVWITAGTALAGISGDWVWQAAGGNPDYNILSWNTNWWWNDGGGSDLLRVGWATSTCANDTVNIPEPTTLLLLGAGLLGLVGIQRKFAK